ncbi:hypothetical protein PC129_g13007 [Phytophthora cactorum]|uniref:Uncharacterized protein n=2 Tax=Phytophthora cactorum TaxID=29920 RepID=A0A8T1HVV7_9STRA|nr:hypothetical protein PC129_g13007 [Phytophthora cactorum]
MKKWSLSEIIPRTSDVSAVLLREGAMCSLISRDSDIEWCVVLVLGAYCKVPRAVGTRQVTVKIWTSEAKEDNIEDKTSWVSLRSRNRAANRGSGGERSCVTIHDYGGASYICSDGDNNAKCSTRDELITALENKFKWQLEYTSPNDDRRVRKDHFYVYTIENTDSGVSIDIFNVDSGDADIHACCQCYGYSDGDDDSCNCAARGVTGLHASGYT